MPWANQESGVPIKKSQKTIRLREMNGKTINISFDIVQEEHKYEM